MGLGRCAKCGESRDIFSDLCPHCGSTSRAQIQKGKFERCPVCKGLGGIIGPDDLEPTDDEVTKLCKACFGKGAVWVETWE